MIVTGVSGTTFTVQRGQEGTTAATHNDGAAITHVCTAAVMQALPTRGLAYAIASGNVIA